MTGGGGIDAFRLARKRAEVVGRLDLRTVPRIADRLAGDEPAAVEWRIVGTADRAGRPALEVSLAGSVPLECQRCLRTFHWPADQRTIVLLARDEEQLAALDGEDDHEVLLASVPLVAQDLVEEEVLLTLPFAPRCGRPDCVAAGGSEAGDKPSGSPFGVLEALKAPAGNPVTKGRSKG